MILWLTKVPMSSLWNLLSIGILSPQKLVENRRIIDDALFLDRKVFIYFPFSRDTVKYTTSLPVGPSRAGERSIALEAVPERAPGLPARVLQGLGQDCVVRYGFARHNRSWFRHRRRQRLGLTRHGGDTH